MFYHRLKTLYQQFSVRFHGLALGYLKPILFFDIRAIAAGRCWLMNAVCSLWGDNWTATATDGTTRIRARVLYYPCAILPGAGVLCYPRLSLPWCLRGSEMLSSCPKCNANTMAMGLQGSGLRGFRSVRGMQPAPAGHPRDWAASTLQCGVSDSWPRSCARACHGSLEVVSKSS